MQNESKKRKKKLAKMNRVSVTCGINNVIYIPEGEESGEGQKYI